MIWNFSVDVLYMCAFHVILLQKFRNEQEMPKLARHYYIQVTVFIEKKKKNRARYAQQSEVTLVFTIVAKVHSFA